MLYRKGCADSGWEWQMGVPSSNSIWVQIPLGKCMNSSLLPQAMGWIARLTGSYSLGWYSAYCGISPKCESCVALDIYRSAKTNLTFVLQLSTFSG